MNMTGEEEIKSCERHIERLQRMIAGMKGSLSRGTNKRTGKPLSPLTITQYERDIKINTESIAFYKEKIKELKIRPPGNDGLLRMSPRELILEIWKLKGVQKYLKEERAKLEGTICDWEEWYKRQDRRPPCERRRSLTAGGSFQAVCRVNP